MNLILKNVFLYLEKIKKILLNTFHLGHQISEFVRIKKFPIDIQIIEDGNEILDTYIRSGETNENLVGTHNF